MRKAADIVNGVLVEIYDKAIKDDDASEKAGTPVFVNAVYIKKKVRNSRDVVDRKMHAKDREEYRELFGKFESGEKIEVNGWLISQWPRVDAVQVETLKGLNIYTVEQLKAADVSQLPRGYLALQKQAEKDLSVDARFDEMNKRMQQLEMENKQLRQQVKKKKPAKKVA